MVMDLSMIDATAATDVGIRRQLRPNQDSYILRRINSIDNKFLFAAVADGHGERAGELASTTAVECAYWLAQRLLQGYVFVNLTEAIHKAVQYASARVNHRLGRAGLLGCGDTMLDAIIVSDSGEWAGAHVGDGRIYSGEIARSALEQLTNDDVSYHSQTAPISDDERLFLRFGQHNYDVTVTLGRAQPDDIQLLRGTLEPAQTIVMVTDGVYEAVHPSEMADCVRYSKNPAQSIVNRARIPQMRVDLIVQGLLSRNEPADRQKINNSLAGSDNATAIVITTEAFGCAR